LRGLLVALVLGTPIAASGQPAQFSRDSVSVCAVGGIGASIARILARSMLASREIGRAALRRRIRCGRGGLCGEWDPAKCGCHASPLGGPAL